MPAKFSSAGRTQGDASKFVALNCPFRYVNASMPVHGPICHYRVSNGRLASLLLAGRVVRAELIP